MVTPLLLFLFHFLISFCFVLLPQLIPLQKVHFHTNKVQKTTRSTSRGWRSSPRKALLLSSSFPKKDDYGLQQCGKISCTVIITWYSRLLCDRIFWSGFARLSQLLQNRFGYLEAVRVTRRFVASEKTHRDDVWVIFDACDSDFSWARRAYSHAIELHCSFDEAKA